MFELKHNGRQTSTRTRKPAVFITMLAIALGVLGVLGTLAWRENAAKVVDAASAVKTERVLIAVEGMSCSSCASGIKAMLKRTPGVISAEVSFEKREADVSITLNKPHARKSSKRSRSSATRPLSKRDWVVGARSALGLDSLT